MGTKFKIVHKPKSVGCGAKLHAAVGYRLSAKSSSHQHQNGEEADEDNEEDDAILLVGAIKNSKTSLPPHVLSRFSSHHILSLLQKLSINSSIALRLFDLVKHYGFCHTLQSYSLIVHILAKSRKLDKVHLVLREFIRSPRHSNLRPAEVVNALMDFDSTTNSSSATLFVLIKVYAECGMLRDAVEAFYLVNKYRFEPFVSSCNFLLKCLADYEELGMTWNIYNQMKEMGISPNVYTYTIMIRACCKEGKIERANGLLGEMQGNRIAPNVVTYTTLIHGLCNLGNTEAALNFLREKTKNSFLFNNYSYNALIHGFCREGELSEAKKIFEEMQSRGLTPDVYSYTSLIDGYCKHGSMEHASDLFTEMTSKGVRPNSITCTSFLDGLCKIGKIDVACKLFMEFKSLGYLPDKISYSIMIDGYCKQGNLEEALILLTEMLGKKTSS